MVRRLLQLLTIVLTVLFVAQNIFKWEIGALLAGLGIGGLAVALAAQQTLSNLFGSITIFADRPFALNDTVRVKGYTGTVQDVGFRSTRLRTPDGTVVTIPNAVVAGEVVESLGSRPGLYHEINLPLKSDTPPAKIARAVEAARQLLRRHRERLLQTPPPRANLTALGPGSCTVNIAYWFASAEPESFHHFNHDFHMDLLAHLAEDAVALA